LSDLRGRKPLFVIGFGIFVIGSLLCSVAMSGEQMIVFRFLQGIGAAMIMSTSPAIITAAFPPQERGRRLASTPCRSTSASAWGRPWEGS
jgi:MFS family permease